MQTHPQTCSTSARCHSIRSQLLRSSGVWTTLEKANARSARACHSREDCGVQNERNFTQQFATQKFNSSAAAFQPIVKLARRSALLTVPVGLGVLASTLMGLQIPSAVFATGQVHAEVTEGKLTVPLSGPEAKQAQVEVSVRLYLPPPHKDKTFASQPPPAFLFSPGFLVEPSAYASYYTALVDQGYPVVTYTKPEALHNLIDDVDSTRVLLAALNWAAAQSAKTPKSPSDSQPEWASVPAADRRFILAGHSRGGKLAALASVLDPRVVGGVLLDPVDGSYEIEQSERYPSALEALQREGRARPVPLLIVGAGHDSDCVSRRYNYTRFFEDSQPPSVELVLPALGHMQFLDQRTAAQDALCYSAPADKVDEQAARKAVAALMGRWGVSAVRLQEARTQLSEPGQVWEDELYAFKDDAHLLLKGASIKHGVGLKL